MHNHWIVLKRRREAGKVWCCDTTDCVPTNTNSVLPHHTLAPLHWQFLRLFFLSAFCCWDLMQRWALLVCRVPSSSHTGSTLLWFHLDWARAQRHQWRWHLSHWWRPPDHQLFTIHDRLGFQKYNRLSKLDIVPEPVWLTFLYHLYLFIGIIDAILSSSISILHRGDHDDHALQCIGELVPGGSRGEWRN